MNDDSDVEVSKEEFCALARKKIKLVYKNLLSDWDDEDEDCEAVVLVGKQKLKINCSKSWMLSSPTLMENFQNGDFRIDPSDNEKISIVDVRTVLQWLKLKDGNLIENPFHFDFNLNYKLSFIELLELLKIQATFGMFKIAKLWKLVQLETEIASVFSTNISNNNANDLLVLTNKFPNPEINMALKNFLLQTNIIKTVSSMELGCQYTARKMLNRIQKDVILDRTMYQQKRKRIPSGKEYSTSSSGEFIPRRSKRSKKMPLWMRLEVKNGGHDLEETVSCSSKNSKKLKLKH